MEEALDEYHIFFDIFNDASSGLWTDITEIFERFIRDPTENMNDRLFRIFLDREYIFREDFRSLFSDLRDTESDKDSVERRMTSMIDRF